MEELIRINCKFRRSVLVSGDLGEAGALVHRNNPLSRAGNLLLTRVATLIVSIVLASCSSHAPSIDQFTISDAGDQFFLNKNGMKVVEVRSHGGTPKLDRVIQPHSSYYFVVYFAGVAGTQKPFHIYEAAVLDDSDAYVGTILYSVRGEDGVEKIRHEYSDERITVYESDEFLEKLDVR